jgi:CheY-like chemotaxis protein
VSVQYSHYECRQISAQRRPARILVVDDNQDNTFLMRELLGTHGYDVSVPASNAHEADTVMHAEPPDLVLLDVVMPGKEWLELCKEWKSDPETRLIPVIMITGLRRS